MEDKKFCKRCNTLKSNSDFNKDKSRKSGLHPTCKDCRKSITKKYRDNNKDKTKAYYEKVKDKLKITRAEYFKQYRARESTKKRVSEYKKNNRDKIKKGYKNYYENNKKDILLKQKLKRENRTKEEIEKDKEYHKKYLENNRERIAKVRRENLRKKYNEDPVFKLKNNIKGLIYKSFRDKNYTKTSRTYKIVGLQYPKLKQYLDDNPYGFKTEDDGLDIDHIIPLSFAKTEEDVIKLNHYTNLQLLPSLYNRVVKKDSVFCKEDFEKWLEENND